MSTLTALQGFYVVNNQPVSQLGFSVGSAGDFNEDGFGDILIGAPYTNGNSGVAYVVYGGPALPKKISISASGPAQGVGTQILCPAATLTGYAVSPAGDVDGNGIGDVLVSVYGDSVVFIVYGDASAPVSISLSTTATSAAYTAIPSPNRVLNYGYGISVSSGGDINNDGAVDILIGEPFFDTNRGQANLVFGPLFAEMTQVLGDTLSTDQLGYSLCGVGDINNDGFDDFALAAPNYNSNAGRVSVIFGCQDIAKFTERDFEQLSLTGPAPNGFYVINVPNTAVDTGVTVAAAGDVNGDGLPDFIIGAPNARTGVGAAYVIFGSTSYAENELDVSSLGSAGFEISGVGGQTGASVAGVGDVNGDGVDDIAVGAPGASAVAVIFGRRTGGTGTVYLTALNASYGFSIIGTEETLFGYSVGSAGDVNGDSYADIVIGAPGANLYAGLTYVIYGAASGFQTASPTLAPVISSSVSSMDKVNRVVNSDWFRFLYSIVSFLASLVAGWLLRKQIAFRILTTWGHKFVFLFDPAAASSSSLALWEIGVKLNARGRPCLVVFGSNVVKLLVDDNNNGISKGLSELLVTVLSNPLISQQFQLTLAEEIQLRDFLLTHQILRQRPFCVCLSYFPELGLVRGMVYAMVLNSFGDAHALYARKVSARTDPSVMRESVIGAGAGGGGGAGAMAPERMSSITSESPLHDDAAKTDIAHSSRPSDIQLTDRPRKSRPSLITPTTRTSPYSGSEESDDDEEAVQGTAGTKTF
eukprot:gene4863-3484_t